MKHFWDVWKPLVLKLFSVIFYPLGLLAALWCAGAMYYSTIPYYGLRIVVSGCVFLLLVLGMFLRPQRYWRLGGGVLFLLIVGYWMTIEPSNDRDWAPEYSRLAHSEVDGDRLTVYNVRDFSYRTETDFTVCYRDLEFDLSKLASLAYIVVHWDGMEAIGHTMLSFGFSDGRHLVVSVETRRDKNDVSGSVPGLFKQFEVIAVWGTEHDLLGLRTNYRHEDVYFYETATGPESIRTLLLDLLRGTNNLYTTPYFYNTLTFNCTKALLPSLRRVIDLPLHHPTFLLNGFSDHFDYECGWLKRKTPDETFESLKARSYINPKVDAFAEPPSDYSERIRSDWEKPY